jgi:hypothetical protein
MMSARSDVATATRASYSGTPVRDFPQLQEAWAEIFRDAFHADAQFVTWPTSAVLGSRGGGYQSVKPFSAA